MTRFQNEIQKLEKQINVAKKLKNEKQKQHKSTKNIKILPQPIKKKKHPINIEVWRIDPKGGIYWLGWCWFS